MRSKLATYFIACEENNYRPWALSYKAFILYGIILLLIRLLLTAPTAGGAAAVDSETIMQLINAERRARNLTTLVFQDSLFKAAVSKSQDMIDRDYFAHVDPDGNYVWKRITEAGYGSYRILGENLAIDFGTSEGMVKAWIDSPSHRANLLHKEFVHQGLAALYGDYQGRYTNLTASLFGTLLKGAAKTKSKPAPKTTAVKPKPQTRAEIIENEAQPVLQVPTATPENLVTAEPRGHEPLQLSRWIYSVFALLMLTLLAVDSIIIHRHAPLVNRSHSTYHFLTLAIFIIVLGLIWWW